MNTPRPSVYNSVLERLKDNAAEDTIHMAREVRGLLEHPGWEFLTDFLAQMGMALDVRVEQGIHEQAEYAAMIAERRSLKTPQSVADAIVEAGRRAEKNLNEMAAQMEARGEYT